MLELGLDRNERSLWPRRPLAGCLALVISAACVTRARLLPLLILLFLLGSISPQYALADNRELRLKALDILEDGLSELRSGDIYAAEDRLTRAESSFRQLTQHSPDDCAALYGWTESLLYLGEAQAVMSEKIRATMEDLRDSDGFNRALHYTSLWARSNQDAKEAARATVRCDPTRLPYRRLLARALIASADSGGSLDRQWGYSEAAHILEDLDRLGASEPGDLMLINRLRGRAR